MTKKIVTDHSIITVHRPDLTDEERERRMQILINTVKEVYRNK